MIQSRLVNNLFKDLKRLENNYNEFDLIKQIQNNQNPRQAFNNLLGLHYKFIFKLCLMYSPHSNKEYAVELFSEAVCGMRHAVYKFDFKKKNNFLSYAVWWIIQYILRYKAADNLISSKHSGEKIDVRFLEYDDEIKFRLYENDENIKIFENKEFVKYIQNKLSKRSKEISKLFFEHNLTMDSIKNIHGVSKERIRQILEEVKKECRNMAISDLSSHLKLIKK